MILNFMFRTCFLCALAGLTLLSSFGSSFFEVSFRGRWNVILTDYLVNNTFPPSPLECDNIGDIRLVAGDFPEEGRVEFCYNNTWGTVCDDSWDTTDASVVCRQLGFFATRVSVASFGQGSGPILLDEARCVGTESRLADCPANPIGDHNCGHSEDTGVRCISGMLFTSCFKVFVYRNQN